MIAWFRSGLRALQHPTWGMAIIATLGCALPLSLGLVSGHSGFLWAAVGAFQAARANPLHRFGMPRMMLLIALGATASALGYWVAKDATAGVLVFALMGLVLAWLQRFGNEAAKLGLGTMVCLCLGQGLQQSGDVANPIAVAFLFILGGLWTALLAFGLRAAHGLRMWPHTPRVKSLLKTLKRHAKRLPQKDWRWHAVTCVLCSATAAYLVHYSSIEHGYWLTLAMLAPLQLHLSHTLARGLNTALAALVMACVLIAIGHQIHEPKSLVLLVLPLIWLCRALQANGYGLYMLQSVGCCLLLTESLARDWSQWQSRLFSAMTGLLVSAGVLVLVYCLRNRQRLTQEFAALIKQTYSLFTQKR